MSRRARSRPSKWDTTLELARAFGHGTPMPGEDCDPYPEPDFGEDPPNPDHRTPIGPLDVQPRNSESRL